MNICFFSREYPLDTHTGGIGTYTYNMATALANLDHNVHVITSTQNSERILHQNGVRIHLINSRRTVPKELWHLRYSYFVAKRISKIDCRFDIVQSSEFASEAFWFSINKKIPLVTRLATPFYLAQKLDGRVILGSRPFLNWMEKQQTLQSDGIFTSSYALANEVMKKWRIQASRVDVIPNSIDVSRVRQLGENAPVPDILKSKDFLLYFGRLEVRKGVRELAQALPSVLKLFPDLCAVFVGFDLGYRGSSMREHILKKLKDHKNQVIFFDNLPQEKLFPIVNAAKIVILPSIWEAFGFVCVEAMALSCPIIATSGSGFEEIIEDDVSGFLVEPGNSALLANKIVNCLRNEKDLIRVTEGARKRAENFEVSKIALRLQAYYEKIRERWLRQKEL